jgi:hypothetical protein
MSKGCERLNYQLCGLVAGIIILGSKEGLHYKALKDFWCRERDLNSHDP